MTTLLASEHFFVRNRIEDSNPYKSPRLSNDAVRSSRCKGVLVTVRNATIIGFGLGCAVSLARFYVEGPNVWEVVRDVAFSTTVGLVVGVAWGSLHSLRPK